MKIQINNGNILQLNSQTPWREITQLNIDNGRIAQIGYPGEKTEPFAADKTIDAAGCYITPGLIDLSVSLREPGPKVKGRVASETKAAAKGGVTALCCTPDSQPVNDSQAVTKLLRELAQQTSACRVYPLGAMTKGLQGEQLSEYAALKEAGCIGLSNGYSAIKDLEITKRCFEYAKTQDMSVFVHPIEPALYKGCMHEGHISTTIGLQGIPRQAESIAVMQLIILAESTGVRLHLSQLSCAESVAHIKDAKAKGLRISADVAIHNLLYTDAQIENFNGMFHCTPPLREESDRLALLKGVNDGVIDAITSAHQPHEEAAKLMPFGETEPGISGVEFLFPSAMRLHQSGELSIERFFSAMSNEPAKVLGLKPIDLAPGNTANIAVFDPAGEWKAEQDAIVSMGKNTPYLGKKLKGRTIATIFEGQLSYR